MKSEQSGGVWGDNEPELGGSGDGSANISCIKSLVSLLTVGRKCCHSWMQTKQFLEKPY